MLKSVTGLLRNRDMVAVRFFSKDIFTKEDVSRVMQDIRRRNEVTRLQEEMDKFKQYIRDENIWGQLRKIDVIEDKNFENKNSIPPIE